MRQDAWTAEDDQLLATTVFRFLEGGQTQLAAFREAAIQLGRTAAACGFRWNATVRKRFKQELKQLREREYVARPIESKAITLPDVVNYLRSLEQQDLCVENDRLRQQVNEQAAFIEKLNEVVRQLEVQVQEVAIQFHNKTTV